MKGSGPCKNKQWVDEWETVELVPKDTETQEEVDQLRAQEWHLNAEHLEAGEFFAIKVDDEEEEDHNFYVCYALGPSLQAATEKRDDYTNVVAPGSYYVNCHFLEWKDQRTRTYYVDYAKKAKLPSHLVAVSALEMEQKPHGGWRLAQEELERVEAVLL